MLISGFTFARNTHKLSYPYVESIKSILPICDEFIIALGRGDSDDCTREQIVGINDPKIRIIDTEWNDLERLRGKIFSRQTNLALDECRGRWCFYLQSDEVVHERYLDTILEACRYFENTPAVDGFCFTYKHFWGDYRHHIISHKWYPREIRVIRNKAGIVSVGDAQSFRYTNGSKVNVVHLDAEIFHYGHVRDPRITHVRKLAMETIYWGNDIKVTIPPVFDYGSLEKLARYGGTHPAVMHNAIAAMNWKHLLQYRGKSNVRLPHERFKYRILTFIEQKVLGGSGREFWGYKPYRILRRLSRQFKRNYHRQ